MVILVVDVINSELVIVAAAISVVFFSLNALSFRERKCTCLFCHTLLLFVKSELIWRAIEKYLQNVHTRGCLLVSLICAFKGCLVHGFAVSVWYALFRQSVKLNKVI